MVKGTIQNRDKFLDKIAENLGRERKHESIARPVWNHQPQWQVLAGLTQDELIDILEKQCETIHTDFIRTTGENLGDAVRQVIDLYEGRSVVTWDDPRFQEFGLEASLEQWQADQLNVFKWDNTNREESVHRAEQADVGITFSDITLAESGTVVLFSGKGKGRSVSLLPETYIAIVPKSTIVPRMSQATREIHRRVASGEAVESCINFITGPSNSADIEMNLVVGVHGPVKTAYIIVEDR